MWAQARHDVLKRATVLNSNGIRCRARALHDGENHSRHTDAANRAIRPVWRRCQPPPCQLPSSIRLWLVTAHETAARHNDNAV